VRRNFIDAFGFDAPDDDYDDIDDFAESRLSPALPTTPEQRLLLLKDLIEDIREWDRDHVHFGVRGSTDQIRLSPLHYDETKATLTSHVGGNTCRVTLNLKQVSDGGRLIPVAIATFSGTCSDYRRKRACIHTLAALRLAQKVLEDEKNELRTKLFFLDELPPAERWKIALKMVDDFLAVSAPAPAHDAPPQTRIAWRVEHKDTIEEQILALHAGKRHLVADVLEGTDQSGKLSTRDLVDLIRGESATEVGAT
jgi:hypothetical protein